MRHIEVKQALHAALTDAIKPTGKPCFTLTDGASVRAASRKVYKPDGLVYSGSRADPDAVEIQHPIIVSEVLSDDSIDGDHGEKLPGYFSGPTVQHYLIVAPRCRAIVHHRRGAGEDLLTRIRTSGRLTCAPLPSRPRVRRR